MDCSDSFWNKEILFEIMNSIIIVSRESHAILHFLRELFWKTFPRIIRWAWEQSRELHRENARYFLVCFFEICIKFQFSLSIFLEQQQKNFQDEEIPQKRNFHDSQHSNWTRAMAAVSKTQKSDTNTSEIKGEPALEGKVDRFHY